jgi:hypothetical protein
MKDHMHHPDRLSRTLCGQPIGSPSRMNMIVWEYGSSIPSCKSCKRLYAQRMAKDGDDQ